MRNGRTVLEHTDVHSTLVGMEDSLSAQGLSSLLPLHRSTEHDLFCIAPEEDPLGPKQLPFLAKYTFLPCSTQGIIPSYPTY